jgi:DNA helicase-2/ATP-dependent DNA helicase PcrA
MLLDLEKELNAQQLKAVTTVAGPCLVLGGAGSGKTLVIAYKVAYLVAERGIAPSHIMVATPTNKTAAEMKSVLGRLLGIDTASLGLWIGTLQSLGELVLRQHIHRLNLGYTTKFVVIDEDDRWRLVRRCLEDLGLNPRTFDPKKTLSRISDAKSNLIGPDEFAAFGYSHVENAVASVYRLYQERLVRLNLLDCDDVLGLVVRVFNEHPEIEEYYSEKFAHVLVDEYEDVSRLQVDFIKRLTKVHGNVTVVGDDDQSVFSYRGANHKFILGFERDYRGATVIKLEQNYRSTQTILDAANALVSRNEARYAKRLWTDNSRGEPVTLFEAGTPEEEANFVADRIKMLVQGGAAYRDVVVIYRVGSQARVIEEVLVTSGIPCVIAGGQRCFESQEVKDVLAYLRLGFNPSDNVSLERAIGRPQRGLGPKGFAEVRSIAVERGMSLFAALSVWLEGAKASRTKDRLAAFVDVIARIGSASDSAVAAANVVFSLSGLVKAYKEQEGIQDFDLQSKQENLAEFMRTIDEFDRTSEDRSLGAYLSQVTLIQDQDSAATGRGDSVVLTTAHAVKGLEFGSVFIVGAEEGIFPHRRSLDNRADIEEERRLFYVACTRARTALFISYCVRRRSYRWDDSQPRSRFTAEIDLVAEAAPVDVSAVVPGKRLELIDGDNVLHHVFGAGKVLEVFYDGDDHCVVVDFKRAGVKKLATAYAELRKVDS